MSTDIDIESKLQSSIVTLLSNENFIKNNSIPVRIWFDAATEISGKQTLVHANPGTPSLMDEKNEAREFNVKIDLMSWTHNTESLTVSTSTLYAFLLGWARDLTAATLATATSLTINGKNLVESGELFDERFRGNTASFEVFVQK